MKKRLSAFIITLGLLVPTLAFGSVSASGVNVFSQLCGNETAQSSTVCEQQAQQKKTGDDPVITAIRITLTLLSVIVGVSAVVVLIIGGFNMVNSGGDAQKVANARSTITYALIGLGVVAFSETIVTFVLSKL
jgi:hypothetical protein